MSSWCQSPHGWVTGKSHNHKSIQNYFSIVCEHNHQTTGRRIQLYQNVKCKVNFGVCTGMETYIFFVAQHWKQLWENRRIGNINIIYFGQPKASCVQNTIACPHTAVQQQYNQWLKLKGKKVNAMRVMQWSLLNILQGLHKPPIQGTFISPFYLQPLPTLVDLLWRKYWLKWVTTSLCWMS